MFDYDAGNVPTPAALAQGSKHPPAKPAAFRNSGKTAVLDKKIIGFFDGR
jgi:hypothetical protein